MVDFDITKSFIGAYATNSNAILHTPAYSVSEAKIRYFPMTYELVSAFSKLEIIAKLQDNWDGYDGYAIQRPIVDIAKSWFTVFAEIIPHAPEIHPNPNGTVVFEWEREQGLASLEIGLSKYSFYLSPASGESFYSDGLHSENAIKSLAALILSVLYPSLNLTSPTSVSHPKFTVLI